VWLVNAGLAVIATLPIHTALDDALSHSRWADVAARRFDLDWFIDFQASAKDAFASSQTMILAAAVITLLLSIFFTSGVLGRLRSDGGVTAATFLADGARYFVRFFLVFLLAGVLSGALVWLFVAKTPEALDVWLRFESSDVLVLVVQGLKLLALLLVLAWIHMAQDVARLTIVVRGGSPLVEFLRGLVVAAQNFGTLLGLYLWTLIVGALMTALYLPASYVAHGLTGTSGTLALFVLMQLYMLVRLLLGFGLTGALYTWYERRFAEEFPAS